MSFTCDVNLNATLKWDRFVICHFFIRCKHACPCVAVARPIHRNEKRAQHFFFRFISRKKSECLHWPSVKSQTVEWDLNADSVFSVLAWNLIYSMFVLGLWMAIMANAFMLQPRKIHLNSGFLRDLFVASDSNAFVLSGMHDKHGVPYTIVLIMNFYSYRIELNCNTR